MSPRPDRRSFSARVTGKPFTFTLDERSKLRALVIHMHRALFVRNDGWRVQLVQDLSQMCQVVHLALDRADTEVADRAQMPLPLGEGNTHDVA